MQDGRKEAQAPLAETPIAGQQDPALLFDIIQEHYDEATFYLRAWDRALGAWDHTLGEVRQGPEEKLRANLDGLLAGGRAAADRLLWPVLEAGEADHWTEPAVAALALLTQPNHATVERVLAQLRPGNAAFLAGVARALELAQVPELDGQLREALYRADEDMHACILGILAERRVDPGPLAAAQLQSRDVATAQAALQAVRHCPDTSMHVRAVRELLDVADARLAVAAVETGLLWGIPAARSACARLARDRDPHAMLLTALIGSEAEQDVIFKAAEDPRHRAAALRALGFAGTARAAETALPLLADADKTVARVAGEAFATITGRDLQDGAFAPSDDAAEDVPGALPALDAVAATAWWKSARSAFPSGVRYLRGGRWPCQDVSALVTRLPMRLRNVGVLELAIRKPRSLPVSIRSWAWKQQAQTDSLLAPARAG